MQAWIWFVVALLIAVPILVIGLIWFLRRKDKTPDKKSSVSLPSIDDDIVVSEGFCTKFVNNTRAPLNIKTLDGRQHDLPPLRETCVSLPDFEDVLVFLDQVPIFVVDKKLLSNPKVYLGSTTTLDIMYQDLNGFLPVMDIPLIRIHNLSLVPLAFGNVSVPPSSTVEYKGSEGNGLAFGTVLEDLTGIFRSIVLQKRVSDIYFGVVSSKPPALFSTQRFPQ
ncbi:putative secreted protein [Insectomime virus]|uniref:Putative secreted protein n=1 Tax=Tunisvirus fontaine2 TaxID=1421067 RepID=V9SDH8_9VIRU|nr:putative secreted protein [Tunisvirus fontaine2]AHA45991.1 putative secreted protein [Insectomime virus]AHC54948.1 putative secreted protein [Tunisvirus fontaine2]